MKKKWIVVLILILLLVGCRKNNLTLDDFTRIGSMHGYITEENKKGYESYQYIKKVYYAINRENAYDIQFLELISDSYAKMFYELNKEELMENIDDNTYIKNKEFSNYSLYHIENDLEYQLIYRSNNNILYIDAPIEYINEIENFLDELDIDF